MQAITDFKKNIKSEKIYIVTVILIAIFAGFTILNQNPYQWLFIALMPIAYFLLKFNGVAVFTILISVFFVDWFIQLQLIPDQLGWLPEIIIFILIIKALILKRATGFVRTPIDIPIVIFLVVALLSIIANSVNPIRAILALRLDIKFILMFYLLVNLNMSEEFYRKIIKIFIILLLIQIPTALIKYQFYGQGEQAIGTYAAWGGGYSIILPMVAISLFGSMFIHNKPRIVYILVICGFIIFSIIGGKKGLIYLGPLLLGYIILHISLMKESRGKIFRSLAIGLLILIMFFPIVMFVPWLTPALEDFSYLKDFVLIYDVKYSSSGAPIGRIPSTITTFETLTKSPELFLLGYGPGSMMKSFFKEFDTKELATRPIDIIYGVTELVLIPIEYGYLGFLIYYLVPLFLLFKINLIFYQNIDDIYWKTISFSFSSIIVSYFLIGVIYMAILRSDLAAFILWFFAASIYSVGRQRKIF
ncbi:MAG: hypothetical protein HXY53_02645 [Nitrospirae bacterium]|nr:hypothetical protein [Nitrospirota bacterium]